MRIIKRISLKDRKVWQDLKNLIDGSGLTNDEIKKIYVSEVEHGQLCQIAGSFSHSETNLHLDYFGSKFTPHLTITLGTRRILIDIENPAVQNLDASGDKI